MSIGLALKIEWIRQREHVLKHQGHFHWITLINVQGHWGNNYNQWNEKQKSEPRCAGNKWQWRGKLQQGVCQWGNVKLVLWWTKVEIIDIWNTFITSIHMWEDCINSTCPCFISSLQWLQLGCWPEQWLLSLPEEFEPMFSSVMSFFAGSPTLWRSCHTLEKNLSLWAVLYYQNRTGEYLCCSSECPEDKEELKSRPVLYVFCCHFSKISWSFETK